ncbi:YybH family protein [Chitinophaga lutea]
MRSLIIFTVLALFSTLQPAIAQSSDEAALRRVLAVQTESWNKGDLESFMGTYWKSDSLMFIGKKGVTYGWQATLDNYKKSYPDKTAMGQLSFQLLEFRKLAPDAYFVVGKWRLARTIGDLSGHFTILVKKIGGQWKITADHSS